MVLVVPEQVAAKLGNSMYRTGKRILGLLYLAITDTVKSYTFIASLVVIVFEIAGLALYIISLRGVYIVGKYSRASTVY
jgi:hypothetical protein